MIAESPGIKEENDEFEIEPTAVETSKVSRNQKLELVARESSSKTPIIGRQEIRTIGQKETLASVLSDVYNQNVHPNFYNKDSMRTRQKTSHTTQRTHRTTNLLESQR